MVSGNRQETVRLVSSALFIRYPAGGELANPETPGKPG